MDIDKITELIISAAIKAHSKLGPGLLESVYKKALAIELKKLNLNFEIEKDIIVKYDGEDLGIGFRCDLLVENEVIVECKAIKDISNMDIAKTINYINLTGSKAGLLMNFNVLLLKDGIRRLFPRSITK